MKSFLKYCSKRLRNHYYIKWSAVPLLGFALFPTEEKQIFETEVKRANSFAMASDFSGEEQVYYHNEQDDHIPSLIVQVVRAAPQLLINLSAEELQRLYSIVQENKLEDIDVSKENDWNPVEIQFHILPGQQSAKDVANLFKIPVEKSTKIELNKEMSLPTQYFPQRPVHIGRLKTVTYVFAIPCTFELSFNKVVSNSEENKESESDELMSTLTTLTPAHIYIEATKTNIESLDTEVKLPLNNTIMWERAEIYFSKTKESVSLLKQFKMDSKDNTEIAELDKI